MARYHEADTHILNIAAEMHTLNSKLSIVKVVCHQSQAHMEGAKAHHRLTELQSLDSYCATRISAHEGGLLFGCGRPSF